MESAAVVDILMGPGVITPGIHHLSGDLVTVPTMSSSEEVSASDGLRR
jgi:hypothetical protein